jgi:predicted anti-sigma-YlaC factor YlaD
MNRLKNFWRTLNLPCCEMTRLASESLDCDLTRLERVSLSLHLAYCAACRRYIRQLARIRYLLRTLAARLAADDSDSLPGPGIPDDVRNRIKCALKDEL